ncbi:MAG: DUF6259 domain-containing protein [Clostridia bacterium]|nr:DUF6259 domain-containing protein [Clostridia bacterium]
MKFEADGLILTLTEDLRSLASMKCGSRELLADTQKPLFAYRLRTKDAETIYATAAEAASADAVTCEGTTTITYRFTAPDAVVRVRMTVSDGLSMGISLENHTEHAVEWIDFPSVTYKGALKESGGDAAVLWPFNEGALIEDSACKRSLVDPEYPSLGSYPMFPNMLFTQFTAYLFGGEGIYMGCHDPHYAPKGIDFANTDDTTEFRTRLFMGGEFGASVGTDYDIVWKHFDGDWYDAAAIYRSVFETLLQPDLPPVSARDDLPAWYKDGMPLVLTYPVRGIHDMDKMDPNKLFPYANVLPYAEEFETRTDSQIMILLMHWEGTAPWAPPYVWPPYGGEEMFSEFRDTLHARGSLLGVYCSGLGYTEQSNLIESYNCAEKIKEGHLDRGMCLAPDQSLPHSKICTGQRSGYDLCPASELGKSILDEAYAPLLASGIDYSQVMDQNHGGTMYFCYAKDHGHPPVPGVWMTEASSELLRGWKDACPDTLLGCESAAAEPHIRTLSLSDNRYELCYEIGRPVPLYAFLFHKYLHNFMGNQVCCPFDLFDTTGVNCRIAYSFLAGDMITLVLNDDGDIMGRWGMRDFSRKPDREAIIDFCSALHIWHKAYPELFRDAEMAKPAAYACGAYPLPLENGRHLTDPAVYSTAWKLNEKTVQIFVNYTEKDETVTVSLPDWVKSVLRLTPEESAVHEGSFSFTIPARSAGVIEY